MRRRHRLHGAYRRRVGRPRRVQSVSEGSGERSRASARLLSERRARRGGRESSAGRAPGAGARAPGRLRFFCLKHAPDAAGVKALQAAIKGREIVRAVGRQAYIVFPDGVGHSRLTSTVIEKHLGTRGTGRNWNTVVKLQKLTSD